MDKFLETKEKEAEGNKCWMLEEEHKINIWWRQGYSILCNTTIDEGRNEFHMNTTI